MKSSIHNLNPTKKPILTWSYNRLTVTLTDPQQQKIICEYRLRFHHNGRTGERSRGGV